MARKRSQAVSPESNTSSEGQPAAVLIETSNAADTAAAHSKHAKRRQLFRIPLHFPRRARQHGSTGSSSSSSRRKLLPHVQPDKLCLHIINELLPQQLMCELRSEVQAGAAPLIAVEQAARKGLQKLGHNDTQKLFFLLAAASSASCGIIHISKTLAYRLAKPLRLGRPMGFVTEVLMPTGLYGPLLAVYLGLAAVNGAVRQLVTEEKAEVSTADAAGSDGQHKHWQQQQQGLEAGSSTAAEAIASSSSSSSSNQDQEDSAAGAAGATTTASGSSSSRVHKHQLQQQQQQERGKPWWVFWKRRQHSQQQQQQQQQEEVPAAEAATASAPAIPEAQAVLVPTDNAANKDSSHSSSSSSSSASGNSGNELDQLVLRKVAPDDHAPAGSPDTAAATADAQPGIAEVPLPRQTAAPAAAGDSSKHTDAEPVTSLEHKQPQECFIMPLLKHHSSPTSSPRTSTEGSDSESPTDHPVTPAQHSSGSRREITPEPHPRLQIRLTPVDLDREHAAAAAAASPTELDHQVDRLHRRWSNGDHEVLAEEALKISQLLSQPFRPPVFSRLASGRAACRITAAAAAKEEAEEHLAVQGSAGSGSSRTGGLGFAAGRSGLNPKEGLQPLSPGVIRGTVSLDLGGHRDGVGRLLPKSLSDTVQMRSAAAGAAAVAAAADKEIHTVATDQEEQQQQQQQEEEEDDSGEGGELGHGRPKMHKSLDWGHKLMTAEH